MTYRISELSSGDVVVCRVYSFSTHRVVPNHLYTVEHVEWQHTTSINEIPLKSFTILSKESIETNQSYIVLESHVPLVFSRHNDDSCTDIVDVIKC